MKQILQLTLKQLVVTEPGFEPKSTHLSYLVAFYSTELTHLLGKSYKLGHTRFCKSGHPWLVARTWIYSRKIPQPWFIWLCCFFIASQMCLFSRQSKLIWVLFGPRGPVCFATEKKKSPEDTKIWFLFWRHNTDLSKPWSVACTPIAHP